MKGAIHAREKRALGSNDQTSPINYVAADYIQSCSSRGVRTQTALKGTDFLILLSYFVATAHTSKPSYCVHRIVMCARMYP